MEETRPLDRSVAQVDAALPIALVTLMEDRAQIERRGTVELGCGTTWVIVRDVAPAASDKSLAVRLGSPDGVRVADARLRRITRVLERDRPASTAQLDREIEELGHREAELAQRQSSLESRRALLEKVGDSTLADLAQDAAWGRAATDDLSGRLRELDRQIAELCERSLTLAAQREDLQLALRDLVRLRASQETPACRRTAQLEIQLISSAAGPVEITVLYVVPGACWRPHHSARLRAGRVFFETEGCVWQNTGEDWADVELVFSTQRESLGHEPPKPGSRPSRPPASAASPVRRGRSCRGSTMRARSRTSAPGSAPRFRRTEGRTGFPSAGSRARPARS
ncbi:MAG: DUF4140 domain-containing protein [Candidatus Riflebacteria bacterium]|nr:DUF4140 domain-containing protein [Candidatus Riflebacteria bacterium]